jgi:hypothetical protein
VSLAADVRGAASWVADSWGGTAAVSRDVKLCGTEICGAKSWGSDSWRMESCGADGSGAVAACRPSVKGWSAAGSNGASTGPAFAVRRAAAQGRPRCEQFRSKCSQPCCAQDRSRQAARTRPLGRAAADQRQEARPARQRRSRFRMRSGRRR